VNAKLWIPALLIVGGTPGCRSRTAVATASQLPGRQTAAKVVSSKTEEAASSKTALKGGKPTPACMDRLPCRSSAATLYVVYFHDQDLYLSPVRQPLSEEGTPLQALRALAAFKPRGDVESPLPPGTKTLSLEVDSSGTATVNFSGEIVTNFPGGSRREQILLNSIADTLTEFPAIRQLQIRVEGRAIDSIGGHVDLEEPLERDLEFVLASPYSTSCCQETIGSQRKASTSSSS
jgi:spore germination protein GerM